MVLAIQTTLFLIPIVDSNFEFICGHNEDTAESSESASTEQTDTDENTVKVVFTTTEEPRSKIASILIFCVFVVLTFLNLMSLNLLKRYRIYLIKSRQRERQSSYQLRSQVPTICAALAPPVYTSGTCTNATYVPPPPYIQCTRDELHLPSYDDVAKNYNADTTRTRL
uniref:G_PROTEIN_RECEP_F1_2 domain-containing protein n=1 Tax=Syphacia muris TaxID=451379 RepID=A0A0N5AI14_9BILA